MRERDGEHKLVPAQPNVVDTDPRHAITQRISPESTRKGEPRADVTVQK